MARLRWQRPEEWQGVAENQPGTAGSTHGSCEPTRFLLGHGHDTPAFVHVYSQFQPWAFSARNPPGVALWGGVFQT